MASMSVSDRGERQFNTKWIAYVGAFTSIVAGIGYVIGYTDVSWAAATLHASPKDFGLSSADYLLIPMWSYVLGSLIVGVSFLAYRSGRQARLPRSVTWLPIVAAAVVVALVMRWTSCKVPWLWCISFPAVGAALGVFIAQTRSGRRGSLSPVICALAWVIVIAGVCLGVGQRWAHGVKAYVTSGADDSLMSGWMTPGRVLNPRDGIVYWQGHDACVFLVGSRVLVSQTQTLVVSELNDFVPTEGTPRCRRIVLGFSRFMRQDRQPARTPT